MATYTANALSSADYAGIQKGDILLFGAYPKTKGGQNEPIEWEVLDTEDGKLFLLSTKAIDAHAYDDRASDFFFNESITWEGSELRAWLHTEFFPRAFNEAERALLAPTSNCEEEGAEPDRVFCLSYEEAVKYKKTAAAKFTDLAKDNGADPYFWNWSTEWWLRSEKDKTEAYYVSAEWGIKDSSDWLTYGIRPALWLDPKGGHPEALSEEVAARFEDTATRKERELAEEAAKMKAEMEREEEAELAFREVDEAPLAGVEATALPFDPKTLRVGDIISFGSYKQGSNEASIEGDKEPIAWKVLDIQGKRALLITEKGIDCRPYHTKLTVITWKSCSLRAWLNKDFLSTAFTEGEAARILSGEIQNAGTPSTVDRIFCLSKLEMQKYFGGDIGDKRGHAAPTDYAVAQGAALSTSSGTCQWWLRTRSERFNDHAMIFCFTSALYGGDKVNAPDYAVRPAMWISLK